MFLMKYFILYATVAVITEIESFSISTAIIVKGTNSFNTIIQIINPVPEKIESNR